MNSAEHSFPLHDQDHYTALVDSGEELFALHHAGGDYHAGLLRFPESRYQTARMQEYSDIFNNVSGVRDALNDISTLTADLISGHIDYSLHKRHMPRRDILERLNQVPFLKRDIELGVHHLTSILHPREIMVNILNDYPDRRYSTDFDFAKKFHVDDDYTVYIQVGGAPLEIAGHYYDGSKHDPQKSEYQDTWMFDKSEQNHIKNIWSLAAGDILMFHGYRSRSCAAHRGPSIKSVRQTGRLAIAMYPL